LQSICLDWLRTMILLISTYWVARVAGVNHWHPAMFLYYNLLWCIFTTFNWGFFLIKVLLISAFCIGMAREQSMISIF
jgi:hypothetical protein